MIAYLLNKLKSLILAVLDLFRKMICCIKRQRHNSGIPLHNKPVASGFHKDMEDTSWDNEGWDACEVVVDRVEIPAAPRTTSEHIAMYRQNVAVSRQKSVPDNEESEPDLFSDMTPQIKKQKKLFIGPKSSVSEQSRLNIENIDPVMTMGSELGNWEEQKAGWDPEDEDIMDAVRDHRRGKL